MSARFRMAPTVGGVALLDVIGEVLGAGEAERLSSALVELEASARAAGCARCWHTQPPPLCERVYL